MNDDLPVLDELQRKHRKPKRPSWAWVAGISAAACTLAAVTALVLASGSVEPSPARAALERAAAAAAATGTQPLSAGQYWYTRMLWLVTAPWPIPPNPTAPDPAAGLFPRAQSAPAIVMVDQRLSMETWIGLDGTIRQREIPLSRRFATAAGRKRWLASDQSLPSSGASDSITGGDSWFPPDDSGFGDVGDSLFSYGQLVSLPAGAAQLRAAITRAQAALQRREKHGLTMQVSPGAGVSAIQISGGSKESAAQVRATNALYTISQLLSTPVTPAVRAALYRAAAGLRGVRYDGSTHDPLSRPGVAVSVPGGVRMVFNPATGALLSFSSGPYLTQVVLAQGIAASVYSLPAGVQPLRAKLPAPQIVSIQPHAGTPSTVFSVQLPATRRPRRPRSAPTVVGNLDGPTGSSCRSYLLPPPFVTLRGDTLSVVHGAASYRYRLAPASIARDAWCPGRYQLQLMGPGQDQTSLYFEIG